MSELVKWPCVSLEVRTALELDTRWMFQRRKDPTPDVSFLLLPPLLSTLVDLLQ